MKVSSKKSISDITCLVPTSPPFRINSPNFNRSFAVVTRPYLAEIMVIGSKHKVIRKRQSLEDLIKN